MGNRAALIHGKKACSNAESNCDEHNPHPALIHAEAEHKGEHQRRQERADGEHCAECRKRIMQADSAAYGGAERQHAGKVCKRGKAGRGKAQRVFAQHNLCARPWQGEGKAVKAAPLVKRNHGNRHHRCVKCQHIGDKRVVHCHGDDEKQQHDEKLRAARLKKHINVLAKQSFHFSPSFAVSTITSSTEGRVHATPRGSSARSQSASTPYAPSRMPRTVPGANAAHSALEQRTTP